MPELTNDNRHRVLELDRLTRSPDLSWEQETALNIALIFYGEIARIATALERIARDTHHR